MPLGPATAKLLRGVSFLPGLPKVHVGPTGACGLDAPPLIAGGRGGRCVRVISFSGAESPTTSRRRATAGRPARQRGQRLPCRKFRHNSHFVNHALRRLLADQRFLKKSPLAPMLGSPRWPRSAPPPIPTPNMARPMRGLPGHPRWRRPCRATAPPATSPRPRRLALQTNLTLSDAARAQLAKAPLPDFATVTTTRA